MNFDLWSNKIFYKIGMRKITMQLTRIRCPICGTSLNEGALDHEVELVEGRDIIK
jgi:hypothetical protein